MEIGDKVKLLRKERHITLTELAEMTDLSVGFLSNLERGQTSPTIAALHTICNAFKITLNDMLDLESANVSKEANVSIVRADDRLPLFSQDNGALRYDAITTGASNIKGTCMTLSSEETVDFKPHEFDELGIIIQGSLEMIINNSSYYLYPGDTIIIKTGTMHSGRKTSQEPSVSYWIKIKPE